MAYTLGRELAATGVPVVSGLAFGVDAAAHEGALAGRGPAVAVMPSGADVAYPALAPRAPRAAVRARPRGLRDAARRDTVEVVLPGAQPHHGRARAHDRGGRGHGDLGLADHGAVRPRPRSRGRRRAGTGHVRARRGSQLAAGRRRVRRALGVRRARRALRRRANGRCRRAGTRERARAAAGAAPRGGGGGARRGRDRARGDGRWATCWPGSPSSSCSASCGAVPAAPTSAAR